MKKNIRLNKQFYQRTDVVLICRELIGKVLVSHLDGVTTAGIIVEAEAYRAPEDQASHAYNNRRTPRTKIMFAPGGVAYIYICYGIHHLFNVVTGPIDVAHAVLIRALEPLEGLEHMLDRRKMLKFEHKLTRGPGALALAMGLNSQQSGSDLMTPSSDIYIEDRQIDYPDHLLAAGPRIGVESAGASASLPWRYYVRYHPCVSANRS